MVRNCPRIAKMKVALTLAWFIAILISSNARADVLTKITIDMQGRPQISIVHDNPVLQQAGWKRRSIARRRAGACAGLRSTAGPQHTQCAGRSTATTGPRLQMSEGSTSLSATCFLIVCAARIRTAAAAYQAGAWRVWLGY